MSVAANDTSNIDFVGKLKLHSDRMKLSERMRKVQFPKLSERMKKLELPQYVKEKMSLEGKVAPLKSAFLQIILLSLIVMTLFSSMFSATVSSHNNMSLIYQESSTNNLDEHTVDLRSEVVGFSNEEYALYPRGSLDSCPPNKAVVTLEQCFEAGKSLGLEKMVNTTINDILVGEWVHTPRGCFSNLGDLHFSYFTGTELDRDTEYWKSYATICSVKDVDPSNFITTMVDYKIQEYGSLDECSEDLLLTTPESCFEAARSLKVGNTLSLDNVIVGSWTHTPRGCFVNQKGGKVLFSNFNGGQLNKGTQFWKDYAAICRNEDSPLRGQ